MTGKRNRQISEFGSTKDTPKGKRVPRSNSVPTTTPSRVTRSQTRRELSPEFRVPNTPTTRSRATSGNRTTKRVEFSPEVEIITRPKQGTSQQLIPEFRNPRVILQRLPTPVDQNIVSSSCKSPSEENSLINNLHSK